MANKEPFVKTYIRLATALDNGDAATILMRLVDWSNLHYGEHQNFFFRDGKWWSVNSSYDIAKQLTYLKPRTIQRRLAELVEGGWLYVANFNRQNLDNRPWYSPNWEKLAEYMPDEIPDYLRSGQSDVPLRQSDVPLRQSDPSSGQSDASLRQSDATSYRDEQIRDEQIRDEHNHNSARAREPMPTPMATAVCNVDTDLFGNELNSLSEQQKGTAKPSSSPSPSSAPKKQKPVKTRICDWEDNDPFAKVFANMTKLSICKAKFDTNEYRTWLTQVMEEYSLTIEELVKLSNEWQEYHNEKTKKPKVAKSSFRTWIGNYVERRSKNGQRQQQQSNGKPAKVDYSADNGKFANFNEDKPWL